MNIVPAPKLELMKYSKFIDANNDKIAAIGEKIEYTFSVKNTGNTTLTNVTISDTKCSPITGSLAILMVGEINTTTFKCTYTITQADIIAKMVENTATGIAKDPKGGEVPDKSDSNDSNNYFIATICA
jgi:hypothetical protein